MTFVDELLKVDRPLDAFRAAHMDWQRLDSLRLVRLLTEVATNGAEPLTLYRLDGYYVSEALETLDQRGDTSREDLDWFHDFADDTTNTVKFLYLLQ